MRSKKKKILVTKQRQKQKQKQKLKYYLPHLTSPTQIFFNY